MSTKEILIKHKEANKPTARWGGLSLHPNVNLWTVRKAMISPVRGHIWLNWTLHNCTTMSESMIQMSWWPNRKQEWETVKDLFLAQAQHDPQRVVAFILRSLKHIGQRWRRKKRSIWDRCHPIASSCCIPHTRGNIPAALHHGGKVKGRQCSKHADLLLR